MLESKALGNLTFWLKTAFLFTGSDYKTLLFPVMISACAISPPTKVSQLLGAAVWVWFHLLQTNVSNQTYSAHEDIQQTMEAPAIRSDFCDGHTTPPLRSIVFGLCLSACHDTGVVVSSAALSLVEILHDDVGFGSTPVLRNLMNVGGYLTFKSGATMIMYESHLPQNYPSMHVVDDVHNYKASRTQFDRTSLIALLVSGLLIFTTIHAQDFADADGDRRSGRRTLPIVAPEGSRVYILTALPLWSIILSTLWGLGPLSAIMFLCMGAFIGSHYFRFRDVKHETSYVL